MNAVVAVFRPVAVSLRVALTIFLRDITDADVAAIIKSIAITVLVSVLANAGDCALIIILPLIGVGEIANPAVARIIGKSSDCFMLGSTSM